MNGGVRKRNENEQIPNGSNDNNLEDSFTKSQCYQKKD